MATPPAQSSRAEAIAAALEAAKLVDRDGFLRALNGVPLRSSLSAPLEERWLAAELAYFRGEYPKTIGLYEAFERDPRSARAPLWQRYRSSHRRAFAYMHQGDDDRAVPALREAEERVKKLPDRAEREPDLDAMQGHLFNHQGNTELARSRFASAYHKGVIVGNWGRAASSAGDVATMFLDLGSLPEAHDWLDRAEDSLRKAPSSLVAATLTVRRAHVLRTEERFVEAEPLYSRLIEGSERHPDPVEAAYRGRGETRLALGRYADAEADFGQAAAICLSQGIRNHAAYAYRGLADVYLGRSGPGDAERAVEQFKRALRLILTLQPPHPGMLVEFSSELLDRPKLLGDKLPEVFQQELRQRMTRLRELSRPQPMHISVRAAERADAYRKLRSTFEQLDLSVLRLAKHTVNLLTGKILPAGKRGRITPAESEVLQLLVDEPAGLTIEEVSQKLDLSLPAATGRMMRLEAVLDKDVTPTRKGNARRYRVHFADQSDQG
jgi:tetratricopeptide (TPR) repeat protein